MRQILTFQFLEVVWQYILGVAYNVTHCFVGNLTGFPVVKEFLKWLRFDEIIVTRGCHVFERQSVLKQTLVWLNWT